MQLVPSLGLIFYSDFPCNLGGPIGPITFTSLSKRSINIQIDKGSELGKYTEFFVEREMWYEGVCKIPIHGILNDCTDGHARQGSNHYRIGADYATGTWSPDDYYVDTLQEDRTHFKFNFFQDPVQFLTLT